MSRVGKALSTWASILLLVPLGVGVWSDFAGVALSTPTITMMAFYALAVAGGSVTPLMRLVAAKAAGVQAALDREPVAGADSQGATPIDES